MLAALVIAILFVNYLLQSPQIELMDLSGMMFYIAAAISHTAMLALIPFVLLFVPIVLISGKELTASIVHIACMSFAGILSYLNGMVFQPVQISHKRNCAEHVLWRRERRDF
jgi:hypothetical protein